MTDKHTPSEAAMRFAVRWSNTICRDDPFTVQLLAKAYDEDLASGAVAELVSALEVTKDWLADKRWRTWPYMEGTGVYDDKQKIDLKISLALANMGVKP